MWLENVNWEQVKEWGLVWLVTLPGTRRVLDTPILQTLEPTFSLAWTQKRLTCQNCRLVGHARFTSKRCPYHNDYKYSILSFLHRYEESGESWELTIFDDSLSCESCGMVGHANNESLRCPDWFGYDNVEKNGKMRLLSGLRVKVRLLSVVVNLWI